MAKVHFKKGEDFKIIGALLLLLIAISYPLAYVKQAQAATGNVTITTSIATSLTFNTTTNASDQFGTTTPGTAKFATTTLDVATNDTLGWVTSLSGDQKNSQPQNNMQLIGATSTQVADQTEWIPGTATTSVGNAIAQGSLTNVLAFRVMTATSTNGASFISTAWWGTNDTSANALWAGIPSSTVQRTIGNAGVGSYLATNHLNTVSYYLKVAVTQPNGNYSAPLTFTAVGN